MNRAALLGTKGQALCMRGFCNRNPDDIEEGLSLFQQAKEIFRKPIDKQRQDSYMMHAQLDLYRVNGELPEEVTHRMQQFVASLSTVDIENNSISVYDLGLALKIIRVLNSQMPFNREMQLWCAAQNWEKHISLMKISSATISPFEENTQSASNRFSRHSQRLPIRITFAELSPPLIEVMF